MALNSQQQAALDHCLTPGPSLNLIARAGTGKTFTLIQIASALPGRMFLGAFNRAIADELKSRVPGHLSQHVNTLHGAGLGAWRKQYRTVKVDGDKIPEMFREILFRQQQEAGHVNHRPQSHLRGQPAHWVCKTIRVWVGFAV